MFNNRNVQIGDSKPAIPTQEVNKVRRLSAATFVMRHRCI